MIISTREAFLGKNKLKLYKPTTSEWIPMLTDDRKWTPEFMDVKGISKSDERIDLGDKRFNILNGQDRLNIVHDNKFSPKDINTFNYNWEWSTGMGLCLCHGKSISPEVVQKAKDYLEAGNRDATSL